MAPRFQYSSLEINHLLKNGWSEDEIETYLPEIAALSDEELLELLSLCGVSLFRDNEPVDPEQAIHVLINPEDTPKDLLIRGIGSMRRK